LNLVAELPEEQQERLLEGPEVLVIDIASNREFSKDNVFAIVFPILAGALFFLAAMIASNYMLKVVVEEKENRMMEVLLTSVSADHLIGGKTLGLLAVCFTQLAIYLVAGVVALLVAKQYVSINVAIPWDFVAIMVLFFLPSFLLNAAVMVGIGGVFEELQQAQQIGAYINLIFLLPIFLMVLFIENPTSPILVLMTFFPPTAFLTISLRWALSSIPTWQIVLSWFLLVFTAVWTAWAAVRIFRIGMLQYGQPLSRKAILDGLRESWQRQSWRRQDVRR
jgi:ABC-2 type transport system permease protein